MSKMLKWDVCIECGPTAADTHHIIVDALTEDSAIKMGYSWALTNNIRHAMISNATILPAEVPNIEEDYTDMLEWTTAEEEEFLRIIDNTDSHFSE